ncbi:hypothetical protein FXO38_11333 [Capsicum annuum]|nr:hypothetical protein FXO38_11333 [Capsicum annuum]
MPLLRGGNGSLKRSILWKSHGKEKNKASLDDYRSNRNKFRFGLNKNFTTQRKKQLMKMTTFAVFKLLKIIGVMDCKEIVPNEDAGDNLEATVDRFHLEGWQKNIPRRRRSKRKTNPSRRSADFLFSPLGNTTSVWDDLEVKVEPRRSERTTSLPRRSCLPIDPMIKTPRDSVPSWTNADDVHHTHGMQTPQRARIPEITANTGFVASQYRRPRNVSYVSGSSEITRVSQFMRLDPPTFMGKNIEEDP